MIGTIINVAMILIGSVLGMFFGARLPERVRQTVIAGLGLFTAVIGIQMTFKTEQSLIVLGSILLGGILGEWLRIEDGLRGVGAWLEKRFAGKQPVVEQPRIFDPVTPMQNDQAYSAANGSAAPPLARKGPGTPLSAVAPSVIDPAVALQDPEKPGSQGSRFIRGFLTASLVYIIGPMAILGSIQDGLTGDFNLLAIKSVLDGFASLAFASSLGIGVMFSSLIVLVYQGAISLLASQAQAWITTPMMNEMTATGGVLLLGIAISSLLEIKPIRVGNFLPALAIAPLIVAILAALKIG